MIPPLEGLPSKKAAEQVLTQSSLYPISVIMSYQYIPPGPLCSGALKAFS
jgi:hypothetical protein